MDISLIFPTKGTNAHEASDRFRPQRDSPAFPNVPGTRCIWKLGLSASLAPLRPPAPTSSALSEPFYSFILSLTYYLAMFPSFFYSTQFRPLQLHVENVQGVYFLFLSCPPAPRPSASSVAGGKGGAAARKEGAGQARGEPRSQVGGKHDRAKSIGTTIPIPAIKSACPFDSRIEMFASKFAVIAKHLPRKEAEVKEEGKERGCVRGPPSIRLPVQVPEVCRGWSLGWARLDLRERPPVTSSSPSHPGATQKVHFSLSSCVCACVPIFIINIGNIGGNNRDAKRQANRMQWA